MELTKCCFILLCVLTIGHQAGSLTVYNVVANPMKYSKVKCALDDNCLTKGVYCLNGGTCIKINKFTCARDSYRCVCPADYTGEECEQPITRCVFDKKWLEDSNCECRNGGICRKHVEACSLESYTCDCLEGFEGTSCQTEISTVDKSSSTDESLPTTIQTNKTQSSTTPTASTASESKSPTTTIAATKTATAVTKTSTSPPPPPPTTVYPTRSNNVTNVTSSSLGPSVQAGYRNESSGGPKKQNAFTATFRTGSTTEETEVEATVTPTIPPAATTTKSPTTITFTTASPTATSENTPTTKASVPILVHNKMCPQGFICKNGDCEPEVLGRGTPKCICEPGWVGDQCDIKCQVKCQNGGICEILDGEPVCRCARGYMGNACDLPEVSKEPIPVLKEIFKSFSQVGKRISPFSVKRLTDVGSPPTSTDPCGGKCGFGTKCEVKMSSGLLQAKCVSQLRKLFRFASFKPANAYVPPDPRKCAANFVCHHGTCDSKNPYLPRCLCDKGYQGILCHIKCDKMCLNEGRCITLGTPREQFCNCPYQYTGEFCHILRTKISIKEVLIPSRDKPVKITTDSPATTRTVNSTTKRLIATRDLRKCSNNFVCVHGICDKSDPDHPRCICEEGFIGSHCHISCTKACINGGTCRVFYDKEFCNCPLQFGGEFCELERQLVNLDVYFDGKDTGANSNVNVA